jgi:DNA-binding NtrC family response regulator
MANVVPLFPCEDDRPSRLACIPSALERIVDKLAGSDVAALFEGETGAGKTHLARAVHAASARAHEPLRVINCAAIPESLLEAELFGHERGAFTGAVASRAGAFEAAGAGTLLLDEIGELTPAAQAKLLRVLDERRFERVGGGRTIALRARVLCATNRDLDAMVDARAFRGDLLFRVAVVRLRVPPLRERPEQLQALAHDLLADAARASGRHFAGFTPAALDLVTRHAWPGNVRELRNAIDHAIALGEGPYVEAHDLPPSVATTDAPSGVRFERLPLNLEALERLAIDEALRVARGNRSRAAELLGISRTTLYNKLARGALTPSRGTGGPDSPDTR